MEMPAWLTIICAIAAGISVLYLLAVFCNSDDKQEHKEWETAQEHAEQKKRRLEALMGRSEECDHGHGHHEPPPKVKNDHRSILPPPSEF